MIVNPIPGHESRNGDYLLEQQSGVKANNLCTLPHKLTQLLTDSPRLQRLRENARRLARPRAAFDVVEQSLAFLKRSRPSRVPSRSCAPPRLCEESSSFRQAREKERWEGVGRWKAESRLRKRYEL